MRLPIVAKKNKKKKAHTAVLCRFFLDYLFLFLLAICLVKLYHGRDVFYIFEWTFLSSGAKIKKNKEQKDEEKPKDGKV